MKLIQTAGLFAAILFFNSCSKKSDSSTPSPAPVVYSTVLAKVYEIDTAKTAPADTVNRWFFTYDNAGRMVKDSFTSTVLYPSTSYYKISTFEYTGADSFVYRKTGYTYTAGSFISADTLYCKFVNGLYDSDTSVYNYGPATPRGTARNTFSYQPGLTVRSFQNWIPQWSSSSTENHRIHQIVSNGNITAQTDTITTITNGMPQPLQTFSTTVSYLSNPNPFYKVTAGYSSGYFRTPGIGNFYDRIYAPRHLIAQQNSSSGDVVYEYVFRADGYPLTARVLLNANGTVTRTKLLFVYQ